MNFGETEWQTLEQIETQVNVNLLGKYLRLLIGWCFVVYNKSS